MIGNRPATDRAIQCFYCGSAFFDVATGYGVCDVCDLRNTFSDVYKSDNGVRPNLRYWSAAEIRRYYARRDAVYAA